MVRGGTGDSLEADQVDLKCLMGKGEPREGLLE